jgi:poly-gamma-glutamate capsule biosynthesis protein CapA/YwtB (metallophosphatase superfamily)
MAEFATVVIGGDCGPAHGPDQGFPIERYTELVLPTLKKADMRFVNCMRTYTSRTNIETSAPQVAQPVVMADLYTNGGFDGVTMANNHAYDCGPEAMLETISLFNSRGIQVTGAGETLADARKAVIVEKNGVKVAYLGYTSVGASGSDAGENKPGVNNMQIHTSFESRGAHGSVRVRTEPDENALARLVEDIKFLKTQVDIVILAFHSGAIRLPRIISDYQVTVAHAAIDAGADLVVGHAPHIPKAIEVYKGKAIFYSIGVFAMTKPFAAPSWSEPAWAHGAVRNHTDLDPNYPLMPYGKECTISLLVKATVGKDGVQQVSFLPMRFDELYRPEVLNADDSRFSEVVDYMEWASVDMPHNFEVVGNEVVVS